MYNNELEYLAYSFFNILIICLSYVAYFEIMFNSNNNEVTFGLTILEGRQFIFVSKE